MNFYEQDDELFQKGVSSKGIEDLQSNEIQRFELLRNELIELEKRVQRSADEAEDEEVLPSVFIDKHERGLLIILLLYLIYCHGSTSHTVGFDFVFLSPCSFGTLICRSPWLMLMREQRNS